MNSVRIPTTLVWVVTILASVVSATRISASEGNSESEPSLVAWLTQIEDAKAKAVEEEKLILLLFTGSDWCPACRVLDKRLRTESDSAQLVMDNFVPVYLDYPRKLELPPQLKAQNEQLRYQFSIEGYPTVFLVDEQLRVYSEFNGSFENIRDAVPEVAEQLAAIQNALGEESWQSCTDPERLAEALSVLPEEHFHRGWEPVFERILNLSETDAPELHEEFSAKYARLKKEKYHDEVNASLGRMLEGRIDRDRFLAFLDEELAVATGDPDRLQILWPTKAAVLLFMKRDQECADFTISGLDAEWVTPEIRHKLKRFLTLSLARLGRTDELREVARQQLSAMPFGSEFEQELAVSAQTGMFLFMGSQYSLSVQEIESLLEQADPESMWYRRGLDVLTKAYDATGHDPLEHAEALMRGARSMGPQERFSAKRYAVKAAVLFRGAGANGDAEAACEFYQNLAAEEPANEQSDKEPDSSAKAKSAVAATEPLSAARGTRGDAFLHLSDSSKAVARVWYLVMASDSFSQAGQTEQAEAALAKAKEVFNELAEPDNVDKRMISRLKARLLHLEGET